MSRNGVGGGGLNMNSNMRKGAVQTSTMRADHRRILKQYSPKALMLLDIIAADDAFMLTGRMSNAFPGTRYIRSPEDAKKRLSEIQQTINRMYNRKNANMGVVKHPCIASRGLLKHQESGAALVAQLANRKTRSLIILHSAGSGKTYTILRMIMWMQLHWFPGPSSAPYARLPQRNENMKLSAQKGLPHWIVFFSEDEQYTDMLTGVDEFTKTILPDSTRVYGGSYVNYYKRYMRNLPPVITRIEPTGETNDNGNNGTNASRSSTSGNRTFVPQMGVLNSRSLHYVNPRDPDSLAAFFSGSSMGGVKTDASEVLAEHLGVSMLRYYESCVNLMSPNANNRREEFMKGMPTSRELGGGAYSDFVSKLVRQNMPGLSDAFKLVSVPGYKVHMLPGTHKLQGGDFVRFALANTSNNRENQAKDKAVSPLFYVRSADDGMLDVECVYHADDITSPWYQAGNPVNDAKTGLRDGFVVYDIYRFNKGIRVTLSRLDRKEKEGSSTAVVQTLSESNLKKLFRHCGGEIGSASKLAWLPYGMKDRFPGDEQKQKEWENAIGFTSTSLRGKRAKVPTTVAIFTTYSNFVKMKMPRNTMIIVDEIHTYTMLDGKASVRDALQKAVRERECYVAGFTATPMGAAGVKDLASLISTVGKTNVNLPNVYDAKKSSLNKSRLGVGAALRVSGVQVSYADLDLDAIVMPTLSTRTIVLTPPPLDPLTGKTLQPSQITSSVEKAVGMFPGAKAATTKTTGASTKTTVTATKKKHPHLKKKKSASSSVTSGTNSTNDTTHGGTSTSSSSSKNNGLKGILKKKSSILTKTKKKKPGATKKKPSSSSSSTKAKKTPAKKKKKVSFV